MSASSLKQQITKADIHEERAKEKVRAEAGL
jgi:hypothetical protein